MPRSLFLAFSGGTASPAPWWPFGLVLRVAGVVCVWGGGSEGRRAQTAGWGRGMRGLVLVSPPSWSLMTKLPVPGAHSCPSHWLISLWERPAPRRRENSGLANDAMRNLRNRPEKSYFMVANPSFSSELSASLSIQLLLRGSTHPEGVERNFRTQEASEVKKYWKES